MDRTKPLTDESPMPFGKYSGQKMCNVPADYLSWLAEQDWIDEWPNVEDYIESNWDVIQQELEGK